MLTLKQCNRHEVIRLLIVSRITEQVWAAYSETCCSLYVATCLQTLNTPEWTTLIMDSINLLLLRWVQDQHGWLWLVTNRFCLLLTLSVLLLSTPTQNCHWCNSKQVINDDAHSWPSTYQHLEQAIYCKCVSTTRSYSYISVRSVICHSLALQQRLLMSKSLHLLIIMVHDSAAQISIEKYDSLKQCNEN